MSVPTEKRIFTTPLSRKIAAEHQIDLSRVIGSGPGGRIRSVDLLQFSAQPPHSRGTDFQQATSRKMTIAGSIPQFSLTIECRVDELVDLRKTRNLDQPAAAKLTFNDMITKATALALENHPGLLTICQQAVGESKGGPLHVSLAVASPRGLVTPVLKGVTQKTLVEISSEVRTLVEKAHQGRLRPNELKGGLFTLTNLGNFGIREFVPVLNPPQVLILGIGEICQLPVVVSGQLKIGWTLRITAGADHRVLNGVEVAEYLKTLREFLEQPSKWTR